MKALATHLSMPPLCWVGLTLWVVALFAGRAHAQVPALGNLGTPAHQTAGLSSGKDLTAAKPKPKAYRLNSGGRSVQTASGRFDADQYYSPSSSAAATTASIAGTADQALYQSERYSTNGMLSYAVPVRNGTYSVVLHFAEIYWTRPGQRVFDISLEGRLVRSHYDIVAKVGPLTATSETLRVTVADGVLNLDLRVPYESGGADQAKLSALEVLPTSATNQRPVADAGPAQTATLPAVLYPPAPTASITLHGTGTDADGVVTGYSWTQLSGPLPAVFSSPVSATPLVSGLVAGTYVFGLVVSDNEGATSDVSTVTITVVPSPYEIVFPVNMGGSAGSTTRGWFYADKYPDFGSARASTTALISGTPDQLLYQSERYSTNGELHFSFDSGNGEYLVILHFAEIYWTQVGQRVFDVSLEGKKVLSNYDIVKKVGPLTATLESFVVPVTDGVLNLDFRVPYESGGVDQAKISAIEILRRIASNPAATSSSQRVAAVPAPVPVSAAVRDLRVYPNPSTGRFTLTCTVPQAQAATLTLSDQRGRTVQERTVHLEAGDNHVVNEVPKVEPGLYLLSLRPAEGPPQRQKLLIRP